MKFLSINTAGPQVQVALYNNGNITYKSDSFKKASVTLFVFIDELLSSANLSINDLDFIGVVTGPGSFTGIRIGLTAVRTLSQFSNITIVPVTYMEVLAYNSEELLPCAVLSDASNGLIYASVFNAQKNCTVQPIALPLSEINAFIASLNAPLKIIACNSLKNSLSLPDQKIIFSSENYDALIGTTLANYKKNGTQGYQKIEPLYVRVSQAEANLK